MTWQFDPTDAFAGGEKIPSLSWRDQPIGSLFKLEVLAHATVLQSRNYETNEPEFWHGDPSRPKNAAVVHVLVLQGPHSVGEERSIWAPIPSSMFIAIKEAQKAAEARLTAGGILTVKFVGEEKHENPRFNPIKKYAAKYEPPAIVPHADPFVEPLGPSATPAPANRPTSSPDRGPGHAAATRQAPAPAGSWAGMQRPAESVNAPPPKRGWN